MFEVDTLGLACPDSYCARAKSNGQPPQRATLIRVDSPTAKEHVARLAESKGYSVTVEELKHETHLNLTPCPISK